MGNEPVLTHKVGDRVALHFFGDTYTLVITSITPHSGGETIRLYEEKMTRREVHEVREAGQEICWMAGQKTYIAALPITINRIE